MHDTTPYRADIDGLRAIAVVSVVAYHVGIAGVPGGFAGVDVFFVISGFLITSLLHREWISTGRVSLGRFYARRVRRLLPALVVVILASLVLGIALLNRIGQQQELAKSAVAALLLFANHYFLAASGGYFDAPAERMPLLHLWSLSVEEQFYLAWPLILLAALGRASAARGHSRAIVIVVGLSIASFGMSLGLIRVAPQAAFYVMPARAWELGVGALLALIPSIAAGRPRDRPLWGTLAGLFGLVLLAATFGWMQRSVPFPGMAALPPVIGTACLIAGNVWAPRGPVARVLGGRALVAVGRLAYGWYLWHWPLIAIARARRLGEPHIVQDVLCAALAFVLAALSLRFIENPLRFGPAARAATSRQTLQRGAAALATAALVAVSIGLSAKFASRSPEERKSLAIDRDTPPYTLPCTHPNDSWNGDLRLTDCTVGPPGAAPRLAIWGDSHAIAWSPMLSVSDGEEVSFVALGMAACPPLLGITPRLPFGAVARGCPAFNSSAIRALADQAGDRLSGVVLAARWPAYLGRQNIPVADHGGTFHADVSDTTPGMALATISSGLARTLAALKSLNVRVAIVLPAPEFRFRLGECILNRAPELCGISRNAYNAQVTQVVEVLRRTAAPFSNVRFLDPAPLLCGPSDCPAFVGGQPVLKDDDHVSMSTARRVGVESAELLQWLLTGAVVPEWSATTRLR